MIISFHIIRSVNTIFAFYFLSLISAFLSLFSILLGSLMNSIISYLKVDVLIIIINIVIIIIVIVISCTALLTLNSLSCNVSYCGNCACN